MQDNISRLYTTLTDNGYEDLGSEDKFRNFVKDSTNVKKLYAKLQEDGFEDLGSEDKFMSFVMPSQPSKPQGMIAAATQKPEPPASIARPTTNIPTQKFTVKEQNEENAAKFRVQQENTPFMQRQRAIRQQAKAMNKPAFPGIEVPQYSRSVADDREKYKGMVTQAIGRAVKAKSETALGDAMKSTAEELARQGYDLEAVQQSGLLNEGIENVLAPSAEAAVTKGSKIIDKVFDDAQKKALNARAEATRYSGMGGTGMMGAGLVMGEKAYNKEIDPEKLQAQLIESIDKDALRETFNEVYRQAVRYGIDPKDYFNSYVAPHLKANAARALDKFMTDQYMPKNDAEYVLSGFSDSITGMLSDWLTKSASQNAYKQMALSKYDASDGMKIARQAVGLIASAPEFAVSGGVSSAVVKKLCGSALTNIMARGYTQAQAQRILASELARRFGKRVGKRIMQSSLSGSVNFAALEGMSEGARQLRDDDFSVGNIAMKTVGGGIKGAIFSAVGGSYAGATEELHGATKVVSNLLGVPVNGAALTISSNAVNELYMMMGEPDELATEMDSDGNMHRKSLLHQWADNTMLDLMMRGTSHHNLNVITKQGRTDIGNRLRSFFSPLSESQKILGANWQSKGISDEGRARLQEITGADNMLDALSYGAPKAVDMEKIVAPYQAGGVKPRSRSVDDLMREEQRQVRQQNWDRIMNDRELSAVDKQKLCQIIGAKYHANPTVSAELVNGVYELRDAKGLLNERREDLTQEERNSIRSQRIVSKAMALDNAGKQSVVATAYRYAERPDAEGKVPTDEQKEERVKDFLQRFTKGELTAEEIVSVEQDLDNTTLMYQGADKIKVTSHRDGTASVEYTKNGVPVRTDHYNTQQEANNAAARDRYQQQLNSIGDWENDVEITLADGQKATLQEVYEIGNNLPEGTLRQAVEGYQGKSMEEVRDELMAEGAESVSLTVSPDGVVRTTEQDRLVNDYYDWAKKQVDGIGAETEAKTEPEAQPQTEGLYQMGEGRAPDSTTPVYKTPEMPRGGNGLTTEAQRNESGITTGQTAPRSKSYETGRQAAETDDLSALTRVHDQYEIAVKRVEKVVPADNPARNAVDALLKEGRHEEAHVLVDNTEMPKQQADALHLLIDADDTIDGVNDAIQAKTDAAMQQIEDGVKAISDEQGNVTFLTLRSGKMVHIVKGDINSPEGTIMVREIDPKTNTPIGDYEQITIYDIKSVGNTWKASDMIAADRERVQGELDAHYRRAMTQEIVEGNRILIKNGRNMEEVTVLSENADGSVTLQDADGDTGTFSREQVEQMAADAKQASYAAWVEAEKQADEQEVSDHVQAINKDNRIGRSLTKPEGEELLNKTVESAAEAPEIELTPENWEAEFGEDGMVKTPLTTVKMGENQYLKLARLGRNGKLGMIKPTLEDPDFIVEDSSEAKEGETRRGSSHVYVRTFIGKDGTRTYHFTSVTVDQNKQEVSISNQEKSPNRIFNLLKNGKLIYIKDKNQRSASETQNGESVLLDDSRTATNADNNTAPLGVNSPDGSSGGKGTDISANNQENSVKSAEKPENRFVRDKKGNVDFLASNPDDVADFIANSGENGKKAVTKELAKVRDAIRKVEDKIKKETAIDGFDSLLKQSEDNGKYQAELDALRQREAFWKDQQQRIRDREDAERKAAEQARIELENKMKAQAKAMGVDEPVAHNQRAVSKGGLVIDGQSTGIDSGTATTLDAIGKALGVEIRIDPSIDTNGEWAALRGRNGLNLVRINPNTREGLSFVYGHEITHEIKNATKGNAELWQGFIQAVRKAIGEEAFDAKVKDALKTWNEHILKKNAEEHTNLSLLTEADAMEEVCCDFVGERIISDRDFANRLLAEVEKSGESSASIAQRIRNFIDKILKAMREIVNPTDAQARQIEALEQAKKIWGDLYEFAAAKEREKREAMAETERQRKEEELRRKQESRERAQQKYDKPINDARKRMGDDPDALAVMEDGNREPKTLKEAVAQMIPAHSLVLKNWTDASGVQHLGLEGETGLKYADLNRLSTFIGARENGAVDITTLAEHIYENLPEDMRQQAPDADRDIRNVIIELFSEAEKADDILHYVDNARIREAEAVYQRNKDREAYEAEREAYGQKTEATDGAPEYDASQDPFAGMDTEDKFSIRKKPEPKPIGTGSFGEIYDQFKGKPKEAIAFLMKKKSGEAIGALHHKDIGDIDLVWGVEGSGHSDGFGLAKLAKFHPEVLENLQELLDDMVVTKRSANRVQLENDTHQAAIRLTWDNKKKTWLLTAFEKKNSALDNTTDTGKTSERGKRNDTATPQSTVFSEGKGTDISANIQTNAGKSATENGNTGKLQSEVGKEQPNSVQSALAQAEKETNTEPTEAQKRAGNYKKGHVRIDGYDVTIENPKGSVRRGTDASGRQWEQEMQNTYGYIRGTEGVDGDHIDVFFSDDPSQGYVFVVDQVNKDGSFDEHKVMYGFSDIESARKAYLSNYEDGWQGLGAITPVSRKEFKKWIDSSHRKTKPFAKYGSVKPLGDPATGMFSIAQRDKEYADAVAAGDKEKVDAMLREEAERKGYSEDSSYQGSIAFNGAAPSRNVYFETRQERKEAFDNGDFEDTYSLGDFVETGLDDHDLEWQLANPIPASGRDKATLESIRNLNNAVKSKSGKIKMYRAVDADIKENSFRNGDWITPSREYAQKHIGLQDWKKGRVIEQEVSIDDVWWDGNDINEWGYDDGKSYVYKNTENNRKLLEATYDDKGNLIPLSKRFDEKKSDVKFSLGKKTPEEFDDVYKKAVENKGYVPEGIEKAEVKVVILEKHPFTGSGKQAIEKARVWAMDNLVGVHTANEGKPDEYKYFIPEEAIDKYLSASSTKHSHNLGLHLATLTRLPEIIENSLDAEIHPDYKKVDRTRSITNGIDKDDMLIHRLYGAAMFDNETYRVKNTIKESKGEDSSAYNYEITKVELPISGSAASDALGNSTFISGANLLKDIVKSYEKDKKLLAQDANSENVQGGLGKSAIYTDNFKKWFGDWENDPENASKVVDENGEPMVMYHGSSVKAKDINVFDMLDGSMGKGAYFTSSYEEACDYAKEALAGTEGFPKNAEDISDEDVEQYVGEYYLNVRDSKNITHSRFDRDAIEVIATSPEQIKSATENNGNFDATNPDIRFSVPTIQKGDTFEDVVRKGQEIKKFAILNRMRQRKGESAEDFIQRQQDYLNLAVKSPQEARNRVVDEIKERLDSKSVDEMGKKALNQLLQAVRDAKEENLPNVIKRVNRTINELQDKALTRQMKKLLDTKTVKRNQRNMSVAGRTDDAVAQAFDFMKGKLVDVDITEHDSEKKRINASIAECNARIRDLERQLSEAADPTEHDRIAAEIADQKDLKDELREELDGVQKEIDKARSENVTVTTQSVNGMIADLNEKFNNSTIGEGEWTSYDAARLTACHILNKRLKLNDLMAESKNLQTEIAQLEAMRTEANKAHNRQQAKMIDRDIVAHTDMMDDILQQIVATKQEINNDLSGMVEGGKTSLMAKKEQEQVRKRSLILGFYNDIASGKFEQPSQEKAKKDAAFEGGVISNIREGLRNTVGSFEYLMQHMPKNTLGQDSWMYRYFMLSKDGVMAAQENYMKGIFETQRTMNDKMKELWGEKNYEDAIKQNEKHEQNHGVTILVDSDGMEVRMNAGEVVNTDGGLSKAQATYLYMVWKMPDGRAKLEKMGFDEQSIAEAVEFIGENNKAWADWVQEEFLPTLREKYNERYVEMYYTSLGKVANYVPLKINQEARHQDVDVDEMMGRQALNQKTGSLINRTHNLIPVDLTRGAYEIISEHVQNMEEWYHMARVRQDLNYILSSTAIRGAMNANERASHSRLVKAAQIATGCYKTDQGSGSKIVSGLTSGLAAANIALRNTTALKQTLSLPAFLGYSQDPRYIVQLLKNSGIEYAHMLPTFAVTAATMGYAGRRAMMNAAGSEKNELSTRLALSNTMRWCIENVPSFRQRVAKGSVGNVLIDEFLSGDKNAWERFKAKLGEYGMAANGLVDATTCAIGIKSIYDYKYGQLKKQADKDLKDGLITQEEYEARLAEADRLARCEADIYYNGTQQSTHPAFLAPIQMDRDLASKMFTLYKNSPLSYARKALLNAQTLYRLRNWKTLQEEYARQYMEADNELSLEKAMSMANNKLTKELGAAAFNTVLYGYFINWLWNWGGKGLLGWLQGEEDEEEEANKTVPMKIAETICPILNGVPMVDFVVNTMAGQDVEPLLLFDVQQRLAKAMKGKEGEVSEGLLFDVVNNIAFRSGLGIDLNTVGNVYLGAEHLVRNGLGEDNRTKMIALMYLLNTPNSNRKQVARTIYSEFDDPDEFVEAVMLADKAVREGTESYKRFMPGFKEYDQKKVDEIIKEWLKLRATPEQKEAMKRKKANTLKELEKNYTDRETLQRDYDNETDPTIKKRMGDLLKKMQKGSSGQGIPVGDRANQLYDQLFVEKPVKDSEYLRLSTSEDVMADNKLAQKRKHYKAFWDELKKITDEDEAREYEQQHKKELERYAALSKIQGRINSLKGKLKKVTDAKEQQEIMQAIRDLRSGKDTETEEEIVTE